MEPSEKDLLDYLNATGDRRIDEEIQNKLREILKCGVCYEVPKEKGLKVRTCEQGHHFCTGCYKNLKHCGICRGQLVSGRNFVVEEIITQLGATFGLTKTNLPVPEEPPKLATGLYLCLHQCLVRIKASYMLNHIRAKHPQNLFDNVRSNPYLKTFGCMFEITFALNQYFVSSFQISDMGLFTVVINISDTHLIGSTHMLANAQAVINFQYKLTVKINKDGYSNEFSVSDCDVFDYNYDTNIVDKSEKCLKIDVNKLNMLVDVGDSIQVLLSVWKKSGETKRNDKFMQKTIVPDNTFIFSSDRKQRRNKQRNIRKKKNRQLIAQAKRQRDDRLIDIFQNLGLT